MKLLKTETAQQPHALRELIRFYKQGEGLELLDSVPPGRRSLLTGMGASYHAAWISALHLNCLGGAGQAIEATDLLYYSVPRLELGGLFIYISQSGSSGEVAPLLERLGAAPLLAVTNDPGSPLAQKASYVLPLLAGEESLIASKTYLNSLAASWLLCRHLLGVDAANEAGMLNQVADRCEQLVQAAEKTAARWMEALQGVKYLVFSGHGPHAATARQAAMLLGEWAKIPALNLSAGGFRHGFIESAGPGMGAVLFAPPGRSQVSMQKLALELQGYGAKVLLVSNGSTYRPADPLPEDEAVDEFLSPVLDILPVQSFADRMAAQLGISPGFRHIQKVVKSL